MTKNTSGLPKVDMKRFRLVVEGSVLAEGPTFKSLKELQSMFGGTVISKEKHRQKMEEDLLQSQ